MDGLTERVREVAGDLRLRADAVGDGLSKAVERVLAERKSATADREAVECLAEAESRRLDRLRAVLEPLAAPPPA